MSTSSPAATKYAHTVVQLPATVETGIRVLFETPSESDAQVYVKAFNKESKKLGLSHRAVIM